MSPDLELLKDVQRILRLYENELGPRPEAENVRRRVIDRMALLVAAVALTATQAAAQHQHPAADMPLHEKFYQGWYMPDNPGRSCCNKADCYPTEIKYVGDVLFAKRREDGKWLLVPAAKIEQHRDNPDGRNHLCAPPPGASYPPDTVFCFALGAGG